MRAIIAITLIAVAVLLAGCVQTGPKCGSPYIEQKTGGCCLDANQNGICDKYERMTAGGEDAKTSSPPSTFTTTLP
ncbi:MAG: hypothetical protein PHG85_04990 [Candidatus Altiarchaeota archaeon]|nr:hypothetical protein [Candidatus Altiarchaeota archaeon]